MKTRRRKIEAWSAIARARGLRFTPVGEPWETFRPQSMAGVVDDVPITVEAFDSATQGEAFTRISGQAASPVSGIVVVRDEAVEAWSKEWPGTARLTGRYAEFDVRLVMYASSPEAAHGVLDDTVFATLRQLRMPFCLAYDHGLVRFQWEGEDVDFNRVGAAMDAVLACSRYRVPLRPYR
jgi:hypothetical protein